MLRCRAKIVWYIVLIVYHGCDVSFDWVNYHNIYKDKDKTVVGVSNSTNTTLVKYETSFWISCLTGSLFSFFMAVVYIHYISYHWECLENGKDIDDMNCKRHFVTLELWISALELLFKDGVQSGILFSLYMSQSIVTKPSWYFITFTVCSVCAHFKLLICFVSKLCGCGAGEEPCCDGDCSCVKIFACVIGFVGSVVCLGLTAASLKKMLSV